MSRWRNIACSLSILLLYFAGSSYASDAAPPDERRLEKVVLRINGQLQAEYALLDPAPITVGRFREAVKAKIETLAKSEEEDRMLLAKALQRILAEERLPNGFNFYLSPTSAKYKKQSLDDDVLGKKVVNLSYNLSVPVPVGKETTQTVRLTSLSEKVFILKKETDVSLGQVSDSSIAAPETATPVKEVQAAVKAAMRELKLEAKDVYVDGTTNYWVTEDMLKFLESKEVTVNADGTVTLREQIRKDPEQ